MPDAARQQPGAHRETVWCDGICWDKPPLMTITKMWARVFLLQKGVACITEKIKK